MTPAGDLPATPNGWAFFLDFDGTLIDIAPTPEAVTIPPELPGVLMRLADRADGALALVSGRPMESLDRFLAPVRLPSAGIHGAEIRLPDGRREMLAAPELEALRGRLRALGVGAPELLVEEKSVSVTIHYRQRPELGPSLRAAILAIISGSPGLVLQPGKMMLEVRPAGADKGQALTRFMEQPPFAGRRPLAIGDDLSDEHMFQVAEKMGGLAVRVGTDATCFRKAAVMPRGSS
jgi:trehalose 6-phosphate phosphatase